MAVVTFSPIDGEFLGRWTGMGMWSKYDATSTAKAVVFPHATAADEHIAAWDSGRLSYLRPVEIFEEEKSLLLRCKHTFVREFRHGLKRQWRNRTKASRQPHFGLFFGVHKGLRI